MFSLSSSSEPPFAVCIELQNVAQFVQHLGRGLSRPRFCEALDLIEKLLQLLGRNRLSIGRLRRLGVLALLLPERLEIAVKRLAKLGHQLLDLFLRRPSFHGVLQTLLSRAHVSLGAGEVPVLDAKGDVPELIDDAFHVFDRGGVSQPPVGGTQAQVNRRRRVFVFGADAKGVEVARDGGRIARILDKRAPLGDDGFRKRLRELAFRQNEAARRAVSHMSGFILGGERHDHRKACPRMGGQILVGLAIGRLHRGAG